MRKIILALVLSLVTAPIIVQCKSKDLFNAKQQTGKNQNKDKNNSSSNTDPSAGADEKNPSGGADQGWNASGGDDKKKPVSSARYPGHNSGLDWMTGLANTDRDNECDVNEEMNKNFLGRRADIFAGFFTHDNIDNLLNHLKAKKDNWTCFTKNQIVLSQVVPILAEDDVKNISQVLQKSSPLSKKYQAFWIAFANLLKSTGQTEPFLRLGHEMNLSGGYPWSVPKNITASQFVALFRLAVDAIKSVLPNSEIVWNPGKYSIGATTNSMWPGDEYVDIVGVDWYDNGGGGVPVFDNQSLWDKHFNDQGSNGPKGIGAWYAFAKLHKKPIAFPEWAMKFGKGDPNRTAYVQSMFTFFQKAANEGYMSYESWYNEPGQHRIYPKSQFPAASKLYPKLW